MLLNKLLLLVVAQGIYLPHVPRWRRLARALRKVVGGGGRHSHPVLASTHHEGTDVCATDDDMKKWGTDAIFVNQVRNSFGHAVAELSRDKWREDQSGLGYHLRTESAQGADEHNKNVRARWALGAMMRVPGDVSNISLDSDERDTSLSMETFNFRFGWAMHLLDFGVGGKEAVKAVLDPTIGAVAGPGGAKYEGQGLATPLLKWAVATAANAGLFANKVFPEERLGDWVVGWLTEALKKQVEKAPAIEDKLTQVTDAFKDIGKMIDTSAGEALDKLGVPVEHVANWLTEVAPLYENLVVPFMSGLFILTLVPRVALQFVQKNREAALAKLKEIADCTDDYRAFAVDVSETLRYVTEIITQVFAEDPMKKRYGAATETALYRFLNATEQCDWASVETEKGNWWNLFGPDKYIPNWWGFLRAGMVTINERAWGCVKARFETNGETNFCTNLHNLHMQDGCKKDRCLQAAVEVAFLDKTNLTTTSTDEGAMARLAVCNALKSGSLVHPDPDLKAHKDKNQEKGPLFNFINFAGATAKKYSKEHATKSYFLSKAEGLWTGTILERILQETVEQWKSHHGSKFSNAEFSDGSQAFKDYVNEHSFVTKFIEDKGGLLKVVFHP